MKLFGDLRKNRARAALLGFLGPAVALAQANLPDPTRPPPGFVDEVPAAGSGNLAEPSSEATARAARAAAEGPSSGLQSVLIPRQGKPVAIIDGKYVPLGERHGEWELVAIAEDEVLLARGNEKKVLKLTPAAEKKLVQPGSVDDRKTQSKPVRKDRTEKADAARKEKSRKESETGR